MKNLFLLFGLVILVLILVVFFWQTHRDDQIQKFSEGLEKHQASSSRIVVMENWQKHTSIDDGFSIFYPGMWSLQTSDVFASSTQWSVLSGASEEGVKLVEITTPEDYLFETNFSEARLSIGKSDTVGAEGCVDVSENLPVSATTTSTIMNGQDFEKIEIRESATGTRYDTTGYRIFYNESCYALEYTIEYAMMELYGDDASVTEFDKTGVEETLDRMARTFRF